MMVILFTLRICFKASQLLCNFSDIFDAVREFANKSAASAASPDYVKFQAVIKSAASAASLCGGRASGRLDPGFLFSTFGRTSGQKIAKISDSV